MTVNPTPRPSGHPRANSGQVPAQERGPRRQYDVPDNEMTREHAKEALRLERELRALGIPVDRIRPSMDFQGHVRMTFDGVDKLLDMIVTRADQIRDLQAEAAELRKKLGLPPKVDSATS